MIIDTSGWELIPFVLLHGVRCASRPGERGPRHSLRSPPRTFFGLNLTTYLQLCKPRTCGNGDMDSGHACLSTASVNHERRRRHGRPKTATRSPRQGASWRPPRHTLIMAASHSLGGPWTPWAPCLDSGQLTVRADVQSGELRNHKRFPSLEKHRERIRQKKFDVENICFF